MSNTHAVISSFLDDDPFDPQELALALSEPEGRALLIDSIALRGIVQPDDPIPPLHMLRPRRPAVWRVAAAAAALVVALAGGYIAGQQRPLTPSAEAPPATRVVQAIPFDPAGGMR
jgi:hypothetical protein